MWKLATALLLGSTFLFSQGCCWPLHEWHEHDRGGWGDRGHHGGWDDRGGHDRRDYERRPAPRRE